MRRIQLLSPYFYPQLQFIHPPHSTITHRCRSTVFLLSSKALLFYFPCKHTLQFITISPFRSSSIILHLFHFFFFPSKKTSLEEGCIRHLYD